MNTECTHIPYGFCQECVKTYVKEAYEDAAKIVHAELCAEDLCDDVCIAVRQRAKEIK